MTLLAIRNMIYIIHILYTYIEILGSTLTQEIYEFRCYARLRPDEPRPSSGRRLHSFVSLSDGGSSHEMCAFRIDFHAFRHVSWSFWAFVTRFFC